MVYFVISVHAQLIVTNVESIYGGRINAITKAPITSSTDSFHIYITTESANTVFYAKAEANPNIIPTISAFAKVPDLAAAADFGSSINKITTHGTNGLLYFLANGKVYSANSTTSAVGVFRSFGSDTTLMDIIIKDNRLFSFVKINAAPANDGLAYSDLSATGAATNFITIASYNTSALLPSKDKMSYVNTDSMFIV